MWRSLPHRRPPSRSTGGKLSEPSRIHSGCFANIQTFLLTTPTNRYLLLISQISPPPPLLPVLCPKIHDSPRSWYPLNRRLPRPPPPRLARSKILLCSVS